MGWSMGLLMRDLCLRSWGAIFQVNEVNSSGKDILAGKYTERLLWILWVMCYIIRFLDLTAYIWVSI